jgi:hypothetical protein
MIAGLAPRRALAEVAPARPTRYFITREDKSMLWTVLLVLLILWALGFGFGVVGNLIHVLLIVAVVVLVLQLLQGRRVV